MGFLIEEHFKRYYYVKDFSSGCIFIGIMYLFILTAPFFASKTSEGIIH